MPGDPVIRLTKHHAAGNDFLVLLDLDEAHPLSGPEVRALCDRRRGIGADGLMRATWQVPSDQGDPRVTMELVNADGSSAEMSGNGIRCFVQAVLGAGLASPPRVAVMTGAGERIVDYEHSHVPGLGFARVSMGVATLGDELSIAEVPHAAARQVSMGNPHVVIAGELPSDAVFEAVATRLQAEIGGVNVEFVSVDGDRHHMQMRVYERGVGETLACGTGACASVAAADHWGMVDLPVEVSSAGGALQVSGSGDELYLAGPTQLVASVDIEADVLVRLVAQLQSADPNHTVHSDNPKVSTAT